jgi:hypothetical protein
MKNIVALVAGLLPLSLVSAQNVVSNKPDMAAQMAEAKLFYQRSLDSRPTDSYRRPLPSAGVGRALLDAIPGLSAPYPLRDSSDLQDLSKQEQLQGKRTPAAKAASLLQLLTARLKPCP